MTSDSNSLTELRYRNDRVAALLQEEISRGDGAERRALQLVSVSGAGAAIVTAFVIAILEGDGPSDVTTVFFVTAVALQLAKSALFSLMAIRPGKIFREDPIALMKERKAQDYAAALQADIELRLWLYKKAVPVHSTKLFYVDRAVRNIAGAIGVALLGTALPLLIALFTSAGTPEHQFMDNVSIAIGILSLMFAVVSDWLIERVDDTWTFPGFRGLNLNE